MTVDRAETIGMIALTWLLGDEDLLPVFLGASGADPADLGAQASDPEFLSSVLDFIALDDAWIVRFCDEAGLRYTDPMTARALLPGGASMHWT